MGWLQTLIVLGIVAVLIGGAGLFAGYKHHKKDLPTINDLGSYQPATVTVVYDRNGQTLAEIYENRRYVLPLKSIPKHVQDAFIAAEDANFWKHTGVDFIGIMRAIGRNLSKGKKAQGASTITQQVARNFF